ncbi:MAG TPA: hypothetical protein VF515_16975, partial [Candidatus Binatia bacterium]
MIDVSRVAGRICGLSAVLLVASGVAVAQSVIFSTGIRVPFSGSTPSDALPILVLADVGSPAGLPDGHLDLITADQAGHATVVLGKGDGTFGISNDILIGLIPTALVVANFDAHDGADLVVADSNSVVFLHGTNDGYFDSPGPA